MRRGHFPENVYILLTSCHHQQSQLGIKIDGELLFHLYFADDIILIDHTPQDLENASEPQ